MILNLFVIAIVHAEDSVVCLLTLRGMKHETGRDLDFMAWAKAHHEISHDADDAYSKVLKFMEAQGVAKDRCSAELLQSKQYLDDLQYSVKETERLVDAASTMAESQASALKTLETEHRELHEEHVVEQRRCETSRQGSVDRAKELASRLDQLRQIACPEIRGEDYFNATHIFDCEVTVPSRETDSSSEKSDASSETADDSSNVDQPRSALDCSACTEYRNGATASLQSLCVGPAEAWGRPCYPRNNDGSCNADWRPATCSASLLAWTKQCRQLLADAVVAQLALVTAPDPCVSHRKELSDEFKKAYISTLKLHEQTAAEASDASCELVANTSFVSRRTTIESKMRECAMEAEKTQKMFIDLDDRKVGMMRALEAIESHVRIVSEECKQTNAVTEYLAGVEDVIQSLEECPGSSIRVELPQSYAGR